MKNYKLTARDNAILLAICNNARLSYNQIAKITHISKDSVRDRMNKLKKEMYILSYFPLVNYPKLELNLFHIYIRLNSPGKSNTEFLNKLKSNTELVSITWIMGKYDLELQMIAKTKKEVKQKIKKMVHSKIIKEMDIIQSEELKFYSMDTGTEEINKKVELNFNSTKIDSTDIQLINLLAKDGRARIIDLAESLKLEEHQVRYRISRLLKEKVILGFYTRTNKHRCGLSSYIMLLKLNSTIDEKKLNLLHEMRNLHYLKKTKGKYQCMIRFHSANNKDLISTLSQIRTILEKEISNFEVFPLLERYKFLPLQLSKSF